MPCLITRHLITQICWVVLGIFGHSLWILTGNTFTRMFPEVVAEPWPFSPACSSRAGAGAAASRGWSCIPSIPSIPAAAAAPFPLSRPDFVPAGTRSASRGQEAPAVGTGTGSGPGTGPGRCLLPGATVSAPAALGVQRRVQNPCAGAFQGLLST